MIIGHPVQLRTHSILIPSSPCAALKETPSYFITFQFLLESPTLLSLSPLSLSPSLSLSLPLSLGLLLGLLAGSPSFDARELAKIDLKNNKYQLQKYLKQQRIDLYRC